MKSPLLLKLSTIFGCLSLLVAACAPAAPTASHSISKPEVTAPTRVPVAMSTPHNVERLVPTGAPLDGNHPSLSADNNTFALELYQALRSQEGNLVYSPYSISLALAMTYGGARGNTEAQMAKTMHFAPQSQLHPAFHELALELAQQDETYSDDQTPFQLEIANAVWAEQSFSFLPDFMDLVARYYGAEIQQADFIGSSGAARQAINGWVSERTDEKIQDLIPVGVLNPDTRMVLVDAIYFKADWMYPFDPNGTRHLPFHLLDGSQAQVEMMSQDLSGVLYVQGSGYQAVELPYLGQSIAMDIIVPDEGQFSGFETTLGIEKLDQILSAMQPGGSLVLGLPRFSFTASFDLENPLTSMGMIDAFDKYDADFSGMTGDQDLYINTVLHKAFVGVDEKGTEAAAATSVIMDLKSAARPQAGLLIDRPFLFVIRDLPSGQILFIGRVLNPLE